MVKTVGNTLNMELINLKSYSNLEEARSDKIFLRQNGIESFLTNDLTTAMLERVNGTVGNLNLIVPLSELDMATELLGLHKKRIEVEHTISNPDYDFLCPECSSNHIFQVEREDGLGLSYVIDKIFPKLFARYKCFYCSNEWKP